MLFQKQIEKIYKNNLFVRNDNADGIFYFAPEDFPGLQSYAYSFPANAGHNLSGWFYCYPDPIPGRLLVFDHGMGNGHRAYMREIEQLAKGGFLVFSYDHTGCMASGGESTNGFAQSLNDLDACIKTLKKESALSDRSISVIGHSWGGFSTMNITALHPEITHVVSMSGFISVEAILAQTISGVLSPWQKSLLALERKANPGYADFNALDSLEKTAAKVLLIYSENDSVVKKQHHYDPLFARLSGRENIRFHLEQGKDHNPTYTAEAVTYKNDFFSQLTRLKKKGVLSDPQKRRTFMDSFDWLHMTRQDSRVWDLIIDHLKKV